MRSIIEQLKACFGTALAAAFGSDAADIDPLLRRAQDPKFGDYQANVAMSLGKKLGLKPRDVAQRIADALRADAAFCELCDAPEIAGPGFINLRLRTSYLAASLTAIPATTTHDADRLGIEAVGAPQTILVDYSGVNVAKQMHVGHLRSTIIGDVFARVLGFRGHHVIRRNHVGDWGLQMGQVLRRLYERSDLFFGLVQGMEAQSAGDAVIEGNLADKLAEIEREYRAAQREEQADPSKTAESREWVKKLQDRADDATRMWEWIRGGTLEACQRIYARLGVLLTREDALGESFYNDRLADTLAELERIFAEPGRPASIRVDQGALCVFHTDANGNPRFKGSDGNPLPLIVRKSDGAYLYATTDLAAVRYRVREEHADRIIYVTDSRQALHFEMVFATAEAAGWTQREGRPPVRLEHVPFGSILGDDRRPLKTRSGENVKLVDLLDEAVARAERLVRDNEADAAKRRGFSDEQIRDIAEAVGIGAVKYADLVQNLASDYVFSWDKMLAMDGNTAPYMMYAYARVRSIYARLAEQEGAAPAHDAPIELRADEETALAKAILQFSDVVDAVAEELRPNLLTGYLYGLAGVFMKFYEACPVLKAETPQRRDSRLRLCDLTARTLRSGLSLLGIHVVERM